MLPRDLFHKHARIGLDLDETLAASIQDGLNILHARGKMLAIRHMEDIWDFDWSRLPGADMSAKELLDFWKMQHLNMVLPVQDAITGVATLFENDK